jgi:hypothetical protein
LHIFARPEYRSAALKTGYMDPPDVASKIPFLAQHGSDACIHSALRGVICIARRALMGLALLNLITFAAL